MMLYKYDVDYFNPKKIQRNPQSKRKQIKALKYKKFWSTNLRLNQFQNFQSDINQRIFTTNNTPVKKNDQSLWRKYCENTPVHGMSYFSNDKIQKFERIIWALIVLGGIVGTIYICILISYRYKSSGIQILVDSTIEPIYNIPFPAVTICNSNRLNWTKIDDAKRKFLGSKANRTSEKVFENFFAKFETFEFGSFELFKKIPKSDLNYLDGINVTEVVEFLSYKCNEIFYYPCLWKNIYVPCCDIFVPQKSEIGYCLSFNSETNNIGKRKKEKDRFYPWRVAKAGPKTGLKIFIRTNDSEKSPLSFESDGITVAVNDPAQWPSNGLFLPSDTNASIIVEPKITYAEEEVRSIDTEINGFIFPDQIAESKIYKTLPGLKYLKKNCISQCHQSHLIRICNCTVDLLFPTENNLTSCIPSDFQCLAVHDEILDTDRSKEEEKYIDNLNKGMTCSCLLESFAIDYLVESRLFPIQSISEEISYVNLEVYFRHSTMMKYRTTLVFSWIDLLVAFGGIAGLFLGCSLFTGAEFIYYITIGWISHVWNK